MTFSVYRVCGHCEYSDNVADGIDVLACTLALMPWTCDQCGRLVSFVIKPSTDADTN